MVQSDNVLGYDHEHRNEGYSTPGLGKDTPGVVGQTGWDCPLCVANLRPRSIVSLRKLADLRRRQIGVFTSEAGFERLREANPGIVVCPSFATTQEPRTAPVTQGLLMDRSIFNEAIKNLVQRLKKFFKVDGDYVEK
ncbi:hypothetical protein AAG570_003808 [Ranatra chinensis]|uniref:Uncharacterized protein n=1 Tax=Ranatra chinensis TaxID=642074 RepID=A0ABD0Y6Y2_9HEMI